MTAISSILSGLAGMFVGFGHAFKSAPITWLTIFFGLLSMIYILGGWKIKPAAMFVMFGLNAAIGCWTLSIAKQSANHDMTFQGVAWLGFSLVWIASAIHDHNKIKKAKKIATGESPKK